jgi:hypothetical protein
VRYLGDGSVDPSYRPGHAAYFSPVDGTLANQAVGAVPDGDGYHLVGTSWDNLTTASPRSWRLDRDPDQDGAPVPLPLPPSSAFNEVVAGAEPGSGFLLGGGGGSSYVAKVVVRGDALGLDLAWGANGIRTLPGGSGGVQGAVQPDGKLLVTTTEGLLRLDREGDVDPSFATVAWPSTGHLKEAYDLAAAPDGAAIGVGAELSTSTFVVTPFVDKYVGRLADVGTTISHSASPGLTQPATVTVANKGPDAVASARLVVEVPAGAAATLTPSRGACSTAGQVRTCTLGTLAAGAEVAVQVEMTWLSGFVSTLVATGSGELFDPDATDQVSSSTITATAPPATSALVPTAAPALTTTGRPVVKGTARVGRKLRATTGTWSATPTSYRFQWLRGGKAIRKATGRAYRLTAKDRGRKVAVRVTALRPGHVRGTATSRAVRVRDRAAPTARRIAAGPPVRGRLIASPPEVGPGQAILLTGVAGGHLPRRVVLQLRTSEGWTSLQRKLTREGGLFRFTHRAPDVADVLAFRVRVPAAPHIGGDLTVTPTRRVVVTT